MLPVVPKSVKIDPELIVRIKTAASLIGYSDNQIIVEAIEAVLKAAEDENNLVPKVVVLLRSARNHQKAPPHFAEPAGQSQSRTGIRFWWAEG